MQTSLIRYFYSYVFKSRTRQGLLFLAIIGLFLSSFSLTVLQGVMGGLQNGLIKRSKNIVGSGFIELNKMSPRSAQYKELLDVLNENKIKYHPELELELLIQKGNYVAPIILHGVDYKFPKPKFLESSVTSEMVLGSDLAQTIKAFYGSKIKIISPANTSVLLGEVPNQSYSRVSDFYTSELPEIDSIHAWVEIGFLQNLIRELAVNKIRFFSESDINKVNELYASNEITFGKLKTWEEMNKALVWALSLETKIMLFLFIGMSFLISICITSGFMIFYNKTKIDLSSFWILGLSRERILRLVYQFSQSLSVLFSLVGVLLGVGFLYLLDSNNFVLMPDYFVERNIPVNFNLTQFFIAFIVPYSIASVFTHVTFQFFKSENESFIHLIRKVS